MIRHLFPALLLLLGSPLFAESLNVRFLAWDEQIAERKLSVAGSDIEGLHPLQRTKDFKVTIEAGFFKVIAVDKGGDEDGPILLPVKVKEGLKHPLVLLLPNPKAASGLAAMVIEDDTASFKWGSVRAFNATPRKLGMSIGANGKLLPVGWKPVDYQPVADKTVAMMIVLPEELKKNQNDRKILFSSIWSGEADTRALAIIVPGTDPRLGPVAVKVISEDRRELAAEKAAMSAR